MKYLTGCACVGSSGVLLLQLFRLKDKVPIVLAAVWDEKGKKAEKGKFGKMLQEWFEGSALEFCAKGEPDDCVKAVGNCLERWIGQLYQGKAVKCSQTILFGMGSYCFYAWEGKGELYLMNRSFLNPVIRKLTFDTDNPRLQYAQWESGLGMLLGTEDFFAGVPQKLLRECFSVKELENVQQVTRHVKEAVNGAAAHRCVSAHRDASSHREGGTGAILLVLKEE